MRSEEWGLWELGACSLGPGWHRLPEAGGTGGSKPLQRAAASATCRAPICRPGLAWWRVACGPGPAVLRPDTVLHACMLRHSFGPALPCSAGHAQGSRQWSRSLARTVCAGQRRRQARWQRGAQPVGAKLQHQGEARQHRGAGRWRCSRARRGIRLPKLRRCISLTQDGGCCSLTPWHSLMQHNT